MSATELLKQAAALPQQEKILFEQLFRAIENSGRGPGLAVPSQWPDFADRMRGIYGDKIARDSQTIISEGRGGR